MNKYFDENKINELYPGAGRYMIPAMLINKGTSELITEAVESNDYFGELKKDGYWYEFVKGYNGNCYLFSRNISKATNLLTEKIDCVPHIKDALNCIPCGTVIIGEIYYPGGTSKNVTEVMGSLPDRAIDVQNKKGLIHYYMHDIIFFEDKNMMNDGSLVRRELLGKVWDLYNLKKYQFLELADIYTDNLDTEIKNAFAAGEEGMVLKKKDGVYEPDKRPKTNLKVKKSDTFDAIITRFEEPTKEYVGKESDTWEWKDENGNLVSKAWAKGWMNSRIVISAFNKDGDLVEIGNVSSGINDITKKDMSLHPEKYLNHVCEIQCMEVDKKAFTLRHAFYIFI